MFSCLFYWDNHDDAMGFGSIKHRRFACYSCGALPGYVGLDSPPDEKFVKPTEFSNHRI